MARGRSARVADTATRPTKKNVSTAPRETSPFTFRRNASSAMNRNTPHQAKLASATASMKRRRTSPPFAQAHHAREQHRGENAGAEKAGGLAGIAEREPGIGDAAREARGDDDGGLDGRHEPTDGGMDDGRGARGAGERIQAQDGGLAFLRRCNRLRGYRLMDAHVWFSPVNAPEEVQGADQCLCVSACRFRTAPSLTAVNHARVCRVRYGDSQIGKIRQRAAFASATDACWRRAAWAPPRRRGFPCARCRSAAGASGCARRRACRQAW